MPPGIRHPNFVCWDDLEAPQHAMLIGYHQTAEYVRSQSISMK